MLKVQLPELINLLQKKEAILITANSRLMQYFQFIYSKQQLNAHQIIYEAPPIFSYEIWLEKYWLTYRNQSPQRASLISSYQSHFLWEEVIEQNNPFFFNIDGLVADVKKAWKLCWSWNISINEANFSTNLDTKIFYEWASCYQRMLDKNGWIDQAMLPSILTEIFTTISSDNKETAIILAGFDRLPASLLKCVEAYSRQVFMYESVEKAANIHKTAFISEEEEIKAVLSWAKNKCSSGEIACVIPNLNPKRNKLERLIQRYFTFEEYNISAGHVFSSYSMIAAALKMLSIKQALHEQKTVTLKDFYFIVEHRYIGAAEERKRSLLLQKIHATENARLSWESFRCLLKEYAINLEEKLQDFESCILPNQAKPSEWSSIFQRLLAKLHWPGAYGLDSQEYQTYKRWLELLHEYQQLDLIFEAISFKKALLILNKIANTIVFQPSKKDAKIHFLGLLEAAGLHFEHLWVTGMSAEEFPANVQLNPFIPPQIQRQYALPHSSHEIEYAFAAKLMGHFISGGKEVIFSYLSQKDGIKIKESPFIRLLPKVNNTNSDSETPPVLLEEISENDSFPLLSHEKVKGGTSLLKNQALCPFRAFAKHRLKVAGFEKLTIGLGEHERGSLVHEAMEKFWKKIQTQQQLLSYTAEALDKIIHDISRQTVKKCIADHPYKSTKLPLVFQKLEIRRLEVLLKKWIQCEIKRPPFRVVSVEENSEINLAGLTLRIRADRIDELAKGRKMVIDYKTGTLPTLSLNDERPENPQLLLYTLLDSDVKSWAFAQVKASDPLFKGISQEATHIDGIKVIDWEIERQLWMQQLKMIAEEFLQGRKDVLPKKESVCENCDFHGLCRIREVKVSH